MITWLSTCIWILLSESYLFVESSMHGDTPALLSHTWTVPSVSGENILHNEQQVKKKMMKKEAKTDAIIVLHPEMSHCTNLESPLLVIATSDKPLEVLRPIIESFCLVCNSWIKFRNITQICVEGYEYLTEVAYVEQTKTWWTMAMCTFHKKKFLDLIIVMGIIRHYFLYSLFSWNHTGKGNFAMPKKEKTEIRMPNSWWRCLRSCNNV